MLSIVGTMSKDPGVRNGLHMGLKYPVFCEALLSRHANLLYGNKDSLVLAKVYLVLWRYVNCIDKNGI